MGWICSVCGEAVADALVSIDTSSGETLCPVHFRRRSTQGSRNRHLIGGRNFGGRNLIGGRHVAGSGSLSGGGVTGGSSSIGGSAAPTVDVPLLINDDGSNSRSGGGGASSLGVADLLAFRIGLVETCCPQPCQKA